MCNKGHESQPQYTHMQTQARTSCNRALYFGQAAMKRLPFTVSSQKNALRKKSCRGLDRVRVRHIEGLQKGSWNPPSLPTVSYRPQATSIVYEVVPRLHVLTAATKPMALSGNRGALQRLQRSRGHCMGASRENVARCPCGEHGLPIAGAQRALLPTCLPTNRKERHAPRLDVSPDPHGWAPAAEPTSA